jgi:DNA-3-methyladenine glycosylase I
MKSRCAWVGNDPSYIEYHDKEWGVKVYGDQKLFEMLTLESFQAGLSWITILKKREAFRIAFENFDLQKVASFDADKIDSLLLNSGIVRHRGKIEAAINNARCILKIIEDQGGFYDFLKPYLDLGESTSKSISKELKKKGFKFVGATTIYSFMQASGMVNDHQVDCFRYKEV